MAVENTVDDYERIWRCTCGWGHYLSIRSIANDPFLTVDGSFRAAGLWEKLKATYQIFRRGHYDTWLEVELDKQTASEIRHELANFIRDP